MSDYRECLTTSDVLLVPRYSEIKSRDDCDVSCFGYSLPIISSPMDMVYSKQMDKLLIKNHIPVIVHRYFKDCKEQLENSYSSRSKFRFFAVGSIYGKHGTNWIDELLDNGINKFCVDMAHGDSKACVDTVTYIYNKMKKSGKIIAGNVVTKSAFRHLEDSGCWAIRVGIGSGATCSTRTNTGFGVPLLTAIQDCVRGKEKALLIADGGIKYPGDIPKAIAFGADLCMLGRQLAATDLAPGECYNKHKEVITEKEKVVYKSYRGMASKEARQGILKEASIEGESGLVEYYGTTEQYLIDLKMNLKAALSYTGALNWKIFRRDVKKIKITSSSWNESLTNIITEKGN